MFALGARGESKRRSIAPIVLGVSAVTISTVEITLLRLGTGFFGEGFNSNALDSRLEQLAFFGLSVLFDVGLVLGLWAVAIPLVRRTLGRGLVAWWALLLIGAGIPSLLAAYRFNVYAIAGDMFSVAILSRSSLASSTSMVGDLVMDQLSLWIGVSAVCVLGIVIVARLLAALESRHPEWRLALALPRPRSCAWTCVAIVLPLMLFVRNPVAGLSDFQYGLERKGADIVVTSSLAWLTDVDGDGFGPFSALPDPAPLDSSRHPYSLEIPGNGIDENGIGGDLPSVDPVGEPVREPLRAGDSPRPHVLVLYLESFRHDLLGKEIDGRPVTPFLNRLAAEGSSSDEVWSHAGWTLDSRSQFFGGRLVQHAGQSTMIDDFRALGYEVLYFSGQDESYGESEEILGVDRADYFYDARRDVERRSSRTTTPVSLQVSWKVLLERVSEKLDEYDGERPLFLYVNLTDTHFPYFHDDLDRILDVPPLTRSAIRASNAEALLRGYANTAANVDRGCARIAERFRDAIGGADHGILVLSDHGEAFYEHGRLGHGMALDEDETRVPFVIWGIGGVWPEPLAPSDIRGLLRRNLSLDRGSTPPVARFVPDYERRLLQYAPERERPRLIGLRGLDGLVIYDFEQNEIRYEPADPTGLPAVSASPNASENEVIRRWESARLRARDAD